MSEWSGKNWWRSRAARLVVVAFLGGAFAAGVMTSCGPRAMKSFPPAVTGEHAAALPDGDTVTLGKGGKVSRLSRDGQEQWAYPIMGFAGGECPPHLLADADRVYFTRSDGVTALRAADGKVAWFSRGPADRMYLSGDLLLAASCGPSQFLDERGRGVSARYVADGKEAFSVPLPLVNFDPLPVEEMAGLFVVQNAGGRGPAVLFDRAGKEHGRLERQVVAVQSAGGGRLVLTGQDVIRLAPAGGVEWATPFDRGESEAGGKFVPLPGGGVVAVVYCQGADGGVRVMRFDPVRGTKTWESHCPPLRATASASEHTAEVDPVGDRLRVVSRGAGGAFEESLDLADGRSIDRRELRP